MNCSPKFLGSILVFVALGVGSSLGAQAESQNAGQDFLRQFAATYRFRLGAPERIKIVDKGKYIFFLRSESRSFKRALYRYEVATKKEVLLLTSEQLLSGKKEELSNEEKARRERMRLAARGIVSYKLSRDQKLILLPLSGKLYIYERKTRNVRQIDLGSGHAIDARFSPDGRYLSYVKAGDLYIAQTKTGRWRRLTKRSRSTITNGLAEFVAQEEMGRYYGYWWSPDSKRLVFQETDNAGVETLGIIDPAQPAKAARNTHYPRAGRKNARIRLGMVDANMKKRVAKPRWLKWDHNSYPYLNTVKWRKGAPPTIIVQNRNQTESLILAARGNRGRTERLWGEKDTAWVNIDQRLPRWLKKEKGFLWMSERSGARQLELHDAQGKLVRQITNLPNGIRTLVHLNEKSKTAVVSGSADPTSWQLYRVSLESGEATPLTQGKGHHRGIFSSRASIFVEKVERLSGEREWIVRDKSGKAIGALRSLVEKPPFTPRLELTTVQAAVQVEGQARKLKYHAAIVRPRKFDAAKKYPVIVYVYGGPGHQVVSTRLHRYLLQQWFADQGFIVVSLDGRGTPGRGRKWERALKGNFVKLPAQDQVAGLQALGKRYPELDLDRVGVYGWSFGGYLSTMLVLKHPEVYRAAVAGAPVTDWLDYDTHYTERYLGLPKDNPAGYEKSSALPLAKNLKRPLLIIHGTSDDNVYFSHAIKLSDALFRAGKKHDFLPLSRYTHMVTDPNITARLYGRILDFFKEELK
jgi:dipeptidyl-peptidase 4